MVGWLVEQGVTHVAMEATGVYWKPVFHALCEADTLEVVLVNARHVKNVPGRKTDVKDSEWLAQLLECGLLRGSFIPPKEIAAIRELTRYRKKTIQARTRELQRLSKVLEDAGIKIDSVASSITTLSARDMIEALIAGERDPRVLADLARGTMRNKIPDLTMACAGRFGDHHALLARMHLDHIDHLTTMIDGLDERIEQVMAPFAQQLRLLRTIPGIGERAAQVLISEIGVDMSRFPTAAHLASWAGLCPGNNESAGRHKSGRTRKGNAEVRDILTECAWSAGKTGSYIGAQFHRLHRRFGKKGGGKAAIAVAHTLIVIVWHVLHDQCRIPRTRPRLLHPPRQPRSTQTPPDPRPAIHGIRGDHHTGGLIADEDRILRPLTTCPNSPAIHGSIPHATSPFSFVSGPARSGRAPSEGG